MNKCIHAEEMLEYAKDAQVMDTPWDLWEVDVDEDEYGGYRWASLGAHPTWHPKRKYRRKPRTININGHEVPAPILTPPVHHSKYYIPDIKFHELYDAVYWERDSVDYHRLKLGIVHLTKEAAIAHAKALLSFTIKPEARDE